MKGMILILNRLIGVYKIHNLINNKVYVGVSTDINKRHMQHRAELRGGYHANGSLQEDWNKYNENDFIFNILELCNESDIFNKEVHWIDKLNTYNEGYNNTIGGMGAKGMKLSNERIEQIRQQTSGSNNPMYGKQHTEETKRKISEANKGNIPPIKGKKITEEHRQNLINNHGGRKLSFEDKEKVKHLLLTTDLEQSEIGKMFNVSQQTIQRVNKELVEAGAIETIEEKEKKVIQLLKENKYSVKEICNMIGIGKTFVNKRKRMLKSN
jgi:group I intron endonuclease